MAKLIFSIAAVLLLASCTFLTGRSNTISSPLAAPPDAHTVDATNAEVLEAVDVAQSLSSIATRDAEVLSKGDAASPRAYFGCRKVDNPANANPYGQCSYGDPGGKKKMVIYGDSTAAMWAATLEGVAAKNGYQMRAYGLSGCPVVDKQFQLNGGNRLNSDCDTYHEAAIGEMEKFGPQLILVTSTGGQKLASGGYPSPDQWRDGWISTLTKLQATHAKVVLIGALPKWRNNGSRCLAAHENDVQACAAPVSSAKPENLPAERDAAEQAGASFVDPTPWVCGEKCQPVIADRLVYYDQYRFTQAYSVYLTGALGEAIAPIMV